MSSFDMFFKEYLWEVANILQLFFLAESFLDMLSIIYVIEDRSWIKDILVQKGT